MCVYGSLICPQMSLQSADTAIASQATGAMSYAFIASLHQNPQQSYMQLLNNIRGILKVKYSQKPQLSASHPMVCGGAAVVEKEHVLMSLCFV